MILTGVFIREEFNNKRININPFDYRNITTNSYDLTLGKKFLRYTNAVIDPKKENPYEIFEIEEDGMVLNQGEFLLGHSVEEIGSDYYVPIIHARSSIARLGLFVHVTADLIDIGSHGNVTFQLYSTLQVRIYPWMRIGQVSFWKPKGDIKLYDGQYQESKGPIGSKFFKDFNFLNN
ncbi:dCTP deaminase [Cardinium endosymbiont of Nabis limbatus]|uniref:dCTP deaminase n=1 Tax=Cardinium endosymbiont of Nabis limbatus TaxID=3066217 RepID=UPI003AF38E4E